MSRCGIFVFFIVAAIALRVADCRSGGPIRVRRARAEGPENCHENEVFEQCRALYDASCTYPDERLPIKSSRKCASWCVCPAGHCRNNYGACIRNDRIVDDYRKRH